MSVNALRYPFADRTRVDGTATCLVTLLVGGTLLRFAARLWSGLMFLAPTFAVVVPPIVLLGLVGDVLAGDGFSPLVMTEMLRLVGRVVGVAPVYLFPAVVIVVAVGYVITTGSIPAVSTGVTTAMLVIVTLFVTVVCAYLFPAATAVNAHEGLRARFRRDALRGVALGTYFSAWVGAAALIVLAWSTLATTISRSVVALLALGWCAYAHVATAALVAEGAGRTILW